MRLSQVESHVLLYIVELFDIELEKMRGMMLPFHVDFMLPLLDILWWMKIIWWKNVVSSKDY